MHRAHTQKSAEETVYVVDDEAPLCEAIELLLNLEGVRVRTFTSAQQFLDSCHEDMAGCVLLDLHMPMLSGLEVQDELQRRDVHIPIIFLTGCGDVPTSAHAFKAGAFDFLEKPVDSDALLARVREALAKDRLTHARRRLNAETSSLYERLTDREKQIFRFVAKGYSCKETAKVLAISHRTVEAHRIRIMEKMQTKSLADVVRMALSMEDHELPTSPAQHQ